ncbi:hypothetical protein TL16_g03328 [Triparma laevis f. inornata]|uniref:Uncharacterized protein n=1 Tax=Triparma laevis f. inornata TaxID=1714386 RepID=A0A9W7A2C1_9STRA|nr:hypothetical protein TL16_g03328 [Triparma laevis f. inornata]
MQFSISAFTLHPTFLSRPTINPNPLYSSDPSSYSFDLNENDDSSTPISSETLDYWSTDTSSPSGISSQTLSQISLDYNFPLTYLADVCVRFGADPPINPDDVLGELIDGEKCFAVLESLGSLDGSEVEGEYEDYDLVGLAEEWGVEVGEVFEGCVREGVGLPFGVRTFIRREEADIVKDILMSSPDRDIGDTSVTERSPVDEFFNA